MSPQQRPKPWYKSKTIWVAVAAGAIDFGTWLMARELPPLALTFVSLMVIIARTAKSNLKTK